MAQIGDEMKTRWPISGVAIVHRTGVLEIGQASVAIAVSAPHRGEAFQAAQYAIDRLKQIVPIWKKEVWSDGSQWIGWEHEHVDQSPRAARADPRAVDLPGNRRRRAPGSLRRLLSRARPLAVPRGQH